MSQPLTLSACTQISELAEKAGQDGSHVKYGEASEHTEKAGQGGTHVKHSGHAGGQAQCSSGSKGQNGVHNTAGRGRSGRRARRG